MAGRVRPTDRTVGAPPANRRRHDMEVVRAYGEEHGESFCGVRFEGEVIKVAFTEGLAAHAEALRSRLESPELLVVEGGTYSRRALEDTCAQIKRNWGDLSKEHYMSIGVSYTSVSVGLTATGVAAAKELHRRYGGVLDITVGFKPYPPGSHRTRLPPAGLPTASLPVAGLRLEIRLGSDVVSAGEDVRGEVRFWNDGRAKLLVDTGSIVAGGIRRPGAGEMSGGSASNLIGTGLMFTLKPGACRGIDLVVGTASCEPNADYVPKPGRYEVVVGIDATIIMGRGVIGRGVERRGMLVASGAHLTLT